MSNKRSSSKSNPQKKPENSYKSFFGYLLLTLFVILIVTSLFSSPQAGQKVEFSTFLDQVAKGSVKEVIIRSQDKVIEGVLADGSKFSTFYIDDASLLSSLKEQNVKITVNPADSGRFGCISSNFITFFTYWFSLVFYFLDLLKVQTIKPYLWQDPC